MTRDLRVLRIDDIAQLLDLELVALVGVQLFETALEVIVGGEEGVGGGDGGVVVGNGFGEGGEGGFEAVELGEEDLIHCCLILCCLCDQKEVRCNLERVGR